MKAIAKSFLFISFSLLLTISACKKNSSNSLGTMPQHFVKRVLIEENTGEWCGFCPIGADTISQIKARLGDKLVAVSIHDNDFLDMSAVYDPIAAALGTTIQYFPTVSLDRSPSYYTGNFWDYDYSTWAMDVQNESGIDHGTGLAMITSISGNKATIEVHVGFLSNNNYDMRLNVFLIENNIPQQNQTFDPGTETAGYQHQQVLRAIATPVLGDPISMSSGNEIVKTYTVNIGSYVLANLQAVAFVEKWGGSTTDEAVYNSRVVSIGQTAAWQ